MAFRIVRNDITKMNTEAIVNTANQYVTVGPGCDKAIYEAAGYDELLEYREANVGEVNEGEVFITPGFKLPAKYIIHAVSPLFDAQDDEVSDKLRSCYNKSLRLAKERDIKSIAFPLISTGGFGYPKEEGMRIAVDEINAFLIDNDMEVYLVVFDDKANDIGKRISPDLQEYIDRNYVKEAEMQEYPGMAMGTAMANASRVDNASSKNPFRLLFNKRGSKPRSECVEAMRMPEGALEDEDSIVEDSSICGSSKFAAKGSDVYNEEEDSASCEEFADFEEVHESKLEERMKHISDTFSEYLMYLIQDKNMSNADVYKRAIVDKKIFSKIKNNPDYHPKKLTALCLCMGAMLNLDETKDLLARAGYALSPCDKTDIIFSYFIENEIYDMIELDIQLEEYGLPCIIE